MDYRFNEASVVLPVELIDKSLQTFVLANGEQSFNVVVSRIDLEADESLAHLCERLLKAWQSQLPQFKMIDRNHVTVGGQAAEYFDCRWEANGTTIHQRQVVALSPGPEPSEPMNGLVITGTCQNQFDDHYTEIFDEFIASIRWRHMTGLARYCFALSVSYGSLHVFAGIQEASTRIDPFEVENGLWQFYDDDGAPLFVKWLQPNRKTATRRESGSYQLIAGSGAGDSETLQSCFALIDHIEENPFIRTHAELRQYLQQR